MKLLFNFQTTDDLGDKQAQVSRLMREYLAAKKDFSVEFKEEKLKKTPEQLKGIYKLYQFSLPHFQKWKPKLNWDLEQVKEFSKAELRYTRDSKPFEIGLMLKLMGFDMREEEKPDALKWCKKIKQNLSFADFTKDQLYNFTKEYEVWAQTAQYEKEKEIKPAWSDVFLEPSELNNYFK